jgi:nitroreductase/NAD-dependent dihydropyrimidine dehydrogenase PreA subunit
VIECPSRVIEKQGKDVLPSQSDDFEGSCQECGHCVAVCPTGALSLDWLRQEDCPEVSPILENDKAEAFLRGRRSVRRFKTKPVEQEKIERLLYTACHAPSAKNSQPWEWIVVNGKDKTNILEGLILDWFKSIVEKQPEAAEALKIPRTIDLVAAGKYNTLRNAPCLIVCHADKNWGWSAEDCTLALSYLELMAPTVGLGATWAGYFMKAYKNYSPLAEALPLPKGHIISGAMMLGYGQFKHLRLPNRKPAVVKWK